MDDQQSFFFAVQEIKTALGISSGAAQARLRELCKSGEVQSWKQPYSMRWNEPHGEGPSERIQPSEWREREIDLMTDSDGCKYFVDVSKTDLLAWLSSNKKAVGKKAKPASKRPRDVVKQAISELWSNGIPDTLADRELVKQLGKWLEQHNAGDISRETILRAAGRRK
jgi:hypothetical protein